jgi:glutamine synthetase
MNTHYAMAAIYGLGLRGIANKTPLPYGPIGSPGVTRATLTKLPISLESATAAFMREGSVARKVFGDFFVDHYGLTREHELELNRRAVTDWESEWNVEWDEIREIS